MQEFNIQGLFDIQSVRQSLAESHNLHFAENDKTQKEPTNSISIIGESVENVLGKITKELPLNIYIDGVERRYNIGGDPSCYYIQVASGAIFTDPLDNQNKLLDVQVMEMYLLFRDEGTKDIDYILNNYDPKQLNSFLVNPKLPLNMILRGLRFDLEKAMAKNYIKNNPSWTVIWDGSVSASSDFNEGVDSKGFLGLTKTADMSEYSDKERNEIFNLEFGERSKVYKITDPKGFSYYTTFVRIRPPHPEKVDFGILQVQIPGFAFKDHWGEDAISKAFTNIACHIIERAFDIANDPRWDRELLPIAELEDYVGVILEDRIRQLA